MSGGGIMKRFLLSGIIFFLLPALFLLSCGSKNPAKPNDSDILQPDDAVDNEIPDSNGFSGTITGVIYSSAAHPGVTVSVKSGYNYIANAITDSTGAYSINAVLDKNSIYCVKGYINNGIMESCFDTGAQTSFTANINPLTDTVAALYHSGMALPEAEGRAREYFKIISGNNLRELDFSFYPKVMDGFSQLASIAGDENPEQAAGDAAEDIIVNYEKGFIYDNLFDGFVITPAQDEMEIENGKENKIRVSLASPSEIIAENFDIAWKLPDGTISASTNFTDISSDVSGDRFVTAALISKLGGSEKIIANKTIQLNFYKALSEKSLLFPDTAKETFHLADSAIGIIIPKGANPTLNGAPVTEIKFSSIEKGSGAIIKEFRLEPAGTQFADGAPLMVNIDIGQLFSGDIKNLRVVRTNSDGSKDILKVAAGDPIMMSAAGDPIMQSAAGDPRMMSAAGDPIMMSAAGDPIMSRFLSFSTSHFSRFSLVQTPYEVDIRKILEAWERKGELQLKDKTGNTLNPFYFIRKSVENADADFAPADKAALQAFFADKDSALGASSYLQKLFSDKTGTIYNYDIFDNYYWIWRFIKAIHQKKADGGNSAKMFPLNERDLKTAVNLLFTGTSYLERNLSAADLLKNDPAFRKDRVTAQFPDIRAKALVAFLGAPASGYAKYASGELRLDGIMNNLKAGPNIKTVLPSALSADSILCAWFKDTGTTNGDIASCISAPDIYDLDENGLITENGTALTALRIKEIHDKYLTEVKNIGFTDSEYRNIIAGRVRTLFIAVKICSGFFTNPLKAAELETALYNSISLFLKDVAEKSAEIYMASGMLAKKTTVADPDGKNVKETNFYPDFLDFLHDNAVGIRSDVFDEYTLKTSAIEISRYDIIPASDSNPSATGFIIKNPVPQVKRYADTTSDSKIFGDDYIREGYKSASFYKILSGTGITDDIKTFENSYSSIKAAVIYKKDGVEHMQTKIFDFVAYSKSASTENPAEDDEAGAIYEGTIFDTATGNPLSGVEVTVFPGPLYFYTGGTGFFRFYGMTDGYYKAVFKKEGYDTLSKTIEITNGKNVKDGGIYLNETPAEIKTVTITGNISYFMTAKDQLPKVVLYDASQNLGEIAVAKPPVWSGTEESVAAGLNFTVQTGSYELWIKVDGYYPKTVPFSAGIEDVDLGDIGLRKTQDCGNEIIENGELCDTTAVSCAAIDQVKYSGGTAACVDCKTLDVSKCMQMPPAIKDENLKKCLQDRNVLADDKYGITELNCNSYGIQSLEGFEKLSNMANLQIVQFADNKITDISALANFRNIRWLALQGNTIEDISPLSGLENLSRLYLGGELEIAGQKKKVGNNISVIAEDSFDAFDDLKELHLGYNKIKDLSALKNLSTLKMLYLQNNLIDSSELAKLSNLQRLEMLDCSSETGSDPIISLQPFSTMTNLKKLILTYNQIADLTGVENLTNLIELGLSSNYVTDENIVYLGNTKHPAIQILWFNWNLLTDITPLSALPALKQVNVMCNDIVDQSKCSVDNTNTEVLSCETQRPAAVCY